MQNEWRRLTLHKLSNLNGYKKGMEYRFRNHDLQSMELPCGDWEDVTELDDRIKYNLERLEPNIVYRFRVKEPKPSNHEATLKGLAHRLRYCGSLIALRDAVLYLLETADMPPEEG